ncbi:hypothetical protein [Paenibacillus sp. FSL H7-0331]|uniref:hypothetical protein n=1 Tax=Paenibacillus sp. FSL H7-0331 TaxID=1920421 RepID=UPI0015C33ECD|nr:hypothetical protein [Paenibacillus sp. FSL H7-0331]
MNSVATITSPSATVASASAAIQPASPQSTAPPTDKKLVDAHVARAIDDDTLEISTNGKKKRFE